MLELSKMLERGRMNLSCIFARALQYHARLYFCYTFASLLLLTVARISVNNRADVSPLSSAPFLPKSLRALTYNE